MDANERFPFSERQLLQGLPPARSMTEITREYQSLISESVDEYAKMHEPDSLRWKKIPELTISLAKDLSSRFGRILEWADDLIPEFDLRPANVQPLYATRSFSRSENPVGEGIESYSFEKTGSDCSAKISLEAKGTTLDMTISLLDNQGTMILPFSLTITDKDTGQLLLEKKEFQTGAAKIRGLQRGAYEILSEQGRRACAFAMAVK